MVAEREVPHDVLASAASGGSNAEGNGANHHSSILTTNGPWLVVPSAVRTAGWATGVRQQ